MSIRRDGSFVRSQRLSVIAKHIAKEISIGNFEHRCELEPLISWIKFELGLTDKKARQYVDDIVAYKGWFYVDGAIVTELRRDLELSVKDEGDSDGV